MKTGEQLKREGQALTAGKNFLFLSAARMAARNICAEKGEVTIDDLRRWADRKDIQPKTPSAWGVLFHGDDWKTIGLAQSNYPSNRRRRIFVYVYVGDGKVRV